MVTAIVFHLAIVHVSVIIRCLCLNEMLRMCYFNATSRYRTSRAKFDTADIDFSLCTHYIYAYGRIDHPPDTISPMDPGRELGDTGAYKDFTSRDLEPNRAPVRILSIGGPNSTSINAFKDLTETMDKLETFSHNAVSFLRQHGFGGLDIDWPYSNTLIMRANLVNLLEVLRQEFDKHSFGDKLLLTVKCAGVYNRIGYDVPDISKYVDYVILSSDDLPLPDPNMTWFRSALYGSNMSVNSTVREWLRQGLPVNKAIVGISAVASSQKLTSTSHHTPGSPAGGPGPLGTEYCNPKGFAFSEVCHVALSSHLYFDNASQMHYLVDHDLWIGYVNISSIKSKMDWMKSLKIRGVMFAGIDEDDFTGEACRQGRSPLLKFIKEQSMLTAPTMTIISLDSSSDTANESRLSTSNNTDFNLSGTYTTLSPSGPDNGTDPPSKLVSNQHNDTSIPTFYLILLFTVISMIILFVSCFFVVKTNIKSKFVEELVEE